MTRIHRCAAAVLCLLTCFCALALPVQAAGEPDINQKVGMTIEHTYDRKPLTGVAFTVYRVAEMTADGTLKPLPSYKAFLEEALASDSAEVWQRAAERMESDATLGEADAVTAVTDASGKAVFNNLRPGLYLIKSTRKKTSDYVYSTGAALVTLPRKTEDGWSYTPTVRTKVSRDPAVGDIRVVKVWKDSCHPERRPKSITIRLMCDGELFQSVTLPNHGKWEYTWKDRDMNHTWTVEEDRVTGYKEPEITLKNGVITVTNTCNRPGEHSKTRLPQTGQLWWPVPVLLCAGLLLVVLGLVCHREDNYED